MIASERARYILNRLKEKEVVTLKEIADELGVSIATVRRDFEKLDEKGLAVKVRSGATRASLPGPSAAPMVTSEKSKEHIEQKFLSPARPPLCQGRRLYLFRRRDYNRSNDRFYSG